MCIARVLVRGFLVACNQCWQCRYQKVEDWAGRCMAEMRTSIGAHFVTLTYGRDEKGFDKAHAQKLAVRDVQLWLKLFRAEGYKLRYVIAGEYGSERGRAHWHAIIFWQASEKGIPDIKDINPQWNKAPPWGRNLNEKHWPHGFSMWEGLTYERARYALKYMMKDAKLAERGAGTVRTKVVASLKPGIGVPYLSDLYEQMARDGLPLRWKYALKVNATGERWEQKEFGVHDRTREICFTAYCEAWEALHGPGSIKTAPASEDLTAWLDKKIFEDKDERWRVLTNNIESKRQQAALTRITRGLYVPRSKLPPVPDWGPEFVSRMKFREHVGWYCEMRVLGNPLLLATYHLERSTMEWQEGEAVEALELKSGMLTGPRIGAKRETYVEHRLRMLREGSKKSVGALSAKRKQSGR